MSPAVSSDLGYGLVLLLAVNTVVWLASLAKRDVSIVDIAWGLGFPLVAWFWRMHLAADAPRAWLVCGLVTLWGLRLAAHIAVRGWGRAEDARYAAMRARAPRSFAWSSLVTVFWLQALLLWIIATPLYLILRSSAPFVLTDALGTVLWVFGFAFETVADAQLASFKNDPRNAGHVMDRGLWRYSRHPNYFGEACLWWGIGVIAAGAGGGGWSLVGPGVLTFLLLKVSGVTLLEKHLSETRPAYREYAARTSAFIPWRPKPSHRVPPDPQPHD